MRSLDTIHLASAWQFGWSVKQIVTYEERIAGAAKATGWTVASPT
jgi:uncharacterized protein